MAATAVADSAEAEQLLKKNNVSIVTNSTHGDETTALSTKSSKKVKLPEEETPCIGTGRFTIGPAPERDWEMVPPDGGWGWCVLVGATLVNILIPGTIKSFGVLMLEFNEVFHSSPSASSGIVALCYFLYSSLGPLSSILSVKWSYRTVTLIGGSFAAFGMILSSLAFSIGYLYISFGALVGAGAGLAFPPTVYIVTSYFVRLRGLANGICMSGSAFGSIVLPPVLRYLLETFGYKGAVLILGGIMLNTWAAALLFQPVEEHMVKKFKEPPPEDEEVPQLDAFEEENQLELGDSVPPILLFHTEENSTSKYANGSPPMLKQRSNVYVEDGKASPINDNFFRSASAAQVAVKAEERTRKISTPIMSKNFQGFAKAGYLPSNPSLLESVPEGKSSRAGSQEAFGKKLTVPKTPKRSPSTSSFQYMSTPFHGSTLSAFEKPSEFASQFSLKSVTDSLAPITYCCGLKKKAQEDGKKEPSKYFDVQLLKDPIYLVILISNCTCAISYTNFLILVPSYAQECGFNKSLGAYLLSIISALDLVGRIGGSALSDVVSTPKRYFFITGLLLSGLSLSAIPLVSEYWSISVFCSVFGIASGINVGVTALVMTEMLGTERLMSSYGISLFMNGILQLIGPPICGFWFEYTKSYKSLFVTLGLILVGGAALWGFVPLINRRRRMKDLSEKA